MSKKSKDFNKSVSGYRVYDVGNGASVLMLECKIDGKIYHNTILRTTKKFNDCMKAKILQYCNFREK